MVLDILISFCNLFIKVFTSFSSPEKSSWNSDITKQYLYQLCLDDFRRKHGYNYVKNALLFPTYEQKIVNKGYVALEIFFNLGLEKIQIILLPAKELNDLYLTNRLISEDVLKCIVHYGDF